MTVGILFAILVAVTMPTLVADALLLVQRKISLRTSRRVLAACTVLAVAATGCFFWAGFTGQLDR